MICTDRGHEFQAKFQWHVEDRGIRHVYIKPRSPQLASAAGDTPAVNRAIAACSERSVMSANAVTL
jgi:hypothetical protein